MRDVSFLEWFLLGMPWEWAAVTAVAGIALLGWAAASTRLDRWRQDRRQRRSGPPAGPGSDPLPGPGSRPDA